MLQHPEQLFVHDSGNCHHSQVANTLMTNALDMVDKATMENKPYTRSEMLQMIKEIRSLTGWSRDQVGVESGLGKQKLKDWNRRGKKIDFLDGRKIVSLHQKVSQSKTRDARSELNSAIRLWRTESRLPAIRTLLVSAYKEIFHEENIPEDISQAPVEALMLSLIMELQLKGEVLNSQEASFVFWLCWSNPAISENNARISISQLINIENAPNIGEGDKLKFFEALIAEGPGE